MLEAFDNLKEYLLKIKKDRVVVFIDELPWMVDKFIGDKGGLYGRVSRPIYLVFGGIPYYLDMLSNKKPLSENVDNLFFANNAPLKTEFDFIFRSLFKDSINYRRVIEYLSTKLIGRTREDISVECKLTGCFRP